MHLVLPKYQLEEGNPMTIVSINFTKLNAKRIKPLKGQIKIQNNINLKDVKPSEIGTGKGKKDALNITFSFKSNYEPKLGSIEIEGNLVYVGAEKEVKSAVTAWGKDKKVPPEIAQEALNNALSRCTLQALVMSRDIGLPPPIQLPTVKSK